MLKLAATLAFGLSSLTAVAAPDWRAAREYELSISSFDIQPKTIRLGAGEPVRLRFVNRSGQRHSLAAKDFFAAASARQRDAQEIGDGKVVVEPGDTREIVLVPRAGQYGIGSGNFLHRLLGMSSRILVE